MGANGGRFLLVTQNIDTLHEEAGSDHLIKVHGTSDRLRCTEPSCANAEPRGSLDRDVVDLTSFADEPSAENLPRCPLCGQILRAHVLFFDEYYTAHVDYRFTEVEQAVEDADLVLFVGTSLSVGVTDLVARGALTRGVPVLNVDPDPPAHAPYRLEPLRAAAESLLPAVVERLRS